MNYVLRSFSYIFHPLFMPLAGVLFYFWVSPRYFSAAFLYSKIFATAIMTVIIPILSFYMLKNLRLVTEIHLKNVKERIYPLAMQALFTFILVQIVFDGYEIPALYFYFVAILSSSISAFLLAILKHKASLHMIGVAGFSTFVFGLSLHFGMNLLWILAILIIGIGGTASSRLEAKAHTYPELIIGFLVGAIPQLLVFTYWL